MSENLLQAFVNIYGGSVAYAIGGVICALLTRGKEKDTFPPIVYGALYLGSIALLWLLSPLAGMLGLFIAGLMPKKSDAFLTLEIIGFFISWGAALLHTRMPELSVIVAPAWLGLAVVRIIGYAASMQNE